jgi:hypothetical protein
MTTCTVRKSPAVDFFTGCRDEVRRVGCKRGVEDVAGRDSSFVDATETEATATKGMLLHFEILRRLKIRTIFLI